MDSKDYLTNKCFCPIPWTGLMYNFNGDVKTCIRSAQKLGNIVEDTIQDIVQGPKATDNRSKMLSATPATQCSPCYDLEKTAKGFDIISDRVYYLKELKTVPLNTYSDDKNFVLRQIDVRWTNLCNFACVYCSPEFSSRWANELQINIPQPDKEQRDRFKEYIFSNTSDLQNVYLAGGEPLLMKENLELLEKLLQDNPNVNLRINTNLSKVDTKVFETVCKFKNVHWIISVESMEHEYEYIRYGGSWQEFLDNLNTVKQLNHKISFNMLHFLLNYLSIFDCIQYFQKLGFHNNSFVVGPMLNPDYLNIRHLPAEVLNLVSMKISEILEQNPGFLLENGLRNILEYLKTPMNKNIQHCLENLQTLDQRRGTSSQLVFADLYQRIKD